MASNEIVSVLVQAGVGGCGELITYDENGEELFTLIADARPHGVTPRPICDTIRGLSSELVTTANAKGLVLGRRK